MGRYLAVERRRSGRSSRRQSAGGFLTAACFTVMVSTAAALPQDERGRAASRGLTRDGYQLAYELRFDESYAAFAQAQRLDPADPAPARAVAAVTWMEILFVQGVGTYAAFQGSASGDTVARPSVPGHLSERFSKHAQRALDVAERAVDSRPEDLDAQYQLGATVGLLALYRGTVEGRAFAAFMDGRRAVAIMKRIREKDPSRKEAALIPGIYRYAVATLPWHKRLVASVAGLPGDRPGGIQLLETAAEEGAETATDAALVLMIAYHREGRRHDAARHLTRLIERHPGNRLLRLNLASTMLEAGDAPAAVEIVKRGVPRPGEWKPPVVTGERALWNYIRGSAHAAIGDPRAEADLRAATASDARDWVRARAHVELARLAFRAGDVPRGQADIEAARLFGRRGRDDTAIDEAERVWAEQRSRTARKESPQ